MSLENIARARKSELLQSKLAYSRLKSSNLEVEPLDISPKNKRFNYANK